MVTRGWLKVNEKMPTQQVESEGFVNIFATTLRIQVCVPLKGINRLTLQSYCQDGIGNIKPTLGKGMDP